MLATESRPARALLAGSTVALVAVLLGLVGFYVLSSQHAAEDRLRQDFVGRAGIAASSTGGALAASEDGNRVLAKEALVPTPPHAGVRR
jgi:hypothetical protein